MIAFLTLSLCLSVVHVFVHANTCKDDCANTTHHTVCFHSQNCGNGLPGQFDYFAFSQIYLPQYCSALTRGVDITARYAFRRCVAGRAVPTLLSIHGLWPNYIDGYPQCCTAQMPFANGTTATSFNPPVDDPALFKKLVQNWSDPASTDAVCGEMWNHEYLKHGSCFLMPGRPRWFLNMSLALHDSLATRSQKIEVLRIKYAGQHFNATEIRKLYPNKIQLVCDPSTMQHDQLVELRTCWNVSATTGEPDGSIDCSPDRWECPPQIVID
jgi:ribonuclease T2